MPALRLFEKPQETPPGLDAIRAWLRKPRPRLHGAWIWVRWILSGVPEAYRYLRKKWPAAREGIRRIATEGEKLARGAVRIGYAAREIGGGVVRSTRALRGSDGKVSGTTARVRELGRRGARVRRSVDRGRNGNRRSLVHPPPTGSPRPGRERHGPGPAGPARGPGAREVRSPGATAPGERGAEPSGAGFRGREAASGSPPTRNPGTSRALHRAPSPRTAERAGGARTFRHGSDDPLRRSPPPYSFPRPPRSESGPTPKRYGR